MLLLEFALLLELLVQILFEQVKHVVGRAALDALSWK